MEIKNFLLFPVQVYAFTLVFDKPVFWFVINVGVSCKAMNEYSYLHGKILEYILSQD